MKTFLNRICLTVALLLSALTASAYDFEVDGIAYNILSATDLTCEVTKSDNPYKGDFIVPSHVNYNNRTLTVIKVGDYCCQKSDITTIKLPSTVTLLGKSCFRDCHDLTSVKLSEGIENLPSSCFDNCYALTSIQIPENIKELGEYCFSNCKNLKTVQLPKGIETLGNFCFSSCEKLTFPVNIVCKEKIGEYCFSGCGGLTDVSVECKYRIHPRAFNWCINLKKIKIITAVGIEYGTFYGCEKLSSITVGSKVEYIAVHGNGGDTTDTPTFAISPSELVINDGESKLLIGQQHHEYGNLVFSSSYLKMQEEVKEVWAPELETLYLGRPLEGYYMVCPKLKTLTLGPSLKYVSLGQAYESGQQLPYLSDFPSLTLLKSLNLEPPAIGTPSENQYATLIVEVPEEALEAYQADPVWGKFWNLKGVGVESVTADSTKTVTGRFDLSGIPVDEDYKGLVIVRFSDGTAKKTIQ